MANEVKHAVVRTDLMAATDVRSNLVSLKFLGNNGKTPTEIDNGNVVKLGDLIDGKRELYAATVPATDSKLSEVVLVASVEIMYDALKQNLDEFVNEAGKNIRGYRFVSGDVFSVTAEAFDGTPKKGSIVELTAGTKLSAVDSATGATVIGKIKDVEIAGRYTYYVIKVD